MTFKGDLLSLSLPLSLSPRFLLFWLCVCVDFRGHPTINFFPAPPFIFSPSFSWFLLPSGGIRYSLSALPFHLHGRMWRLWWTLVEAGLFSTSSPTLSSQTNSEYAFSYSLTVREWFLAIICVVVNNTYTTTTPWLYSPCRTLASFTTIFQSSLLCALIHQFVTPILLRSSLTSSIHLNLGLPTLLLLSAVFWYNLFTALSSLILSTCPSHLSLPFFYFCYYVQFSI